MKKLIVTAVAAMMAASLPMVMRAEDYNAYYHDLPVNLTEVKAPVIPDYTVKITDFGGVNDGVTSNTEAFAKAMAHLKGKGGGRLIVPEGIWYTGPIEFESNVELNLERGALLLFSDRLSDYPAVTSNWEGSSTMRAISPLTARGKKNIAVTGDGTINGNGQAWRPVKKGKMTENQWKELTKKGVTNAKGDVWYANQQIADAHNDKNLLAEGLRPGAPAEAVAKIHDYLRPVLVSFIDCENVLLKDATFENSPAWNIHPLLCRNLIIDNVNVRNPWYAQNGDGLDVESCTDVLLVNSKFDVGDDAICIKSGKDKEGRDRGVPCSNVLVDGCTVYHGHGGFVIGSEMSGGCKDIVVRNCVFIGTDVGLRFKSARGRGGVVENIYIDGVKMADIPGDAIIFDLYYGGKGEAEMKPVTEETPSFRDIYINDVTCRGAARAAYFNGLPEMPVKNIVISDSRFKATTGMLFNFADGVTLKNVKVSVAEGQPITEGKDVKGLKIE